MSEKLWQGRFDQPTDKMVEEYTASIHFDSRLYRYDIEGSIAHCRMLADCGIISHDEASQIVQALGEIRRETERGELNLDPSQEDIHMAVEQRLMQKIGEVGGKLHTARSRNDQIALDTRLYMRDVLLQCRRLLLDVITGLTDLAEKNLHVILPGFTHLQHAQPVLLAHHLLAYCEMFLRDEERMAQCFNRTNVMPLGSAALAGTTFPIDMERTARQLGFPRVIRNSMDAVSDRDYLIEFCAAGALAMMHISRLSEELVLWSSPEFDFVEISDAFCTGSSIMPQKKNPDVPELMRGKTGRIYGNLMALLTLTKGLPLTYNRDLQEDKEPAFDTADTLLSTLAVLNKMLPALQFHEEKMVQAAAQSFALATDVADYLVLKGVPFRKAHHVVGQLVSHCIREGKDLSDCTLDELKKFHKALEEDIFSILDIRSAVDRRRSLGGTSTERVREALEATRADVESRRRAADGDAPVIS
ncbi:argininosuccinate lyase [Desulfacinum hydrothermale DSM 13146]|uniref:Argininosuccinate lyase n=1 Tax=Desulfacinum hydrothermale DSM 13146 TaxID=1121390 RepID=A0A1W1X8H8_9BACT|nr:argininosuccinate lyase [Desulfacinum hydrothermale]SMC20127.1 argininosuccinate lyase [Desulfacinum hydrothermale DSM 13146]